MGVNFKIFIRSALKRLLYAIVGFIFGGILGYVFSVSSSTPTFDPIHGGLFLGIVFSGISFFFGEKAFRFFINCIYYGP